MSDFTVLISEVHPANEMGNDLLFLKHKSRRLVFVGKQFVMVEMWRDLETFRDVSRLSDIF